MKMYFEFDKQDYYGLITVETDPDGYCFGDATKVYVETVSGESIEEVLEEGPPKQVTKEYAFWKFANCDDNADSTVGDLLEEFEKIENNCVVIDGSLC